jgi:hypothetical protein
MAQSDHREAASSSAFAFARSSLAVTFLTSVPVRRPVNVLRTASCGLVFRTGSAASELSPLDALPHYDPSCAEGIGVERFRASVDLNEFGPDCEGRI